MSLKFFINYWQSQYIVPADADDNCPEIANGPNLGTCIAGTVGEPCNNNAACEIDGLCSINQEDSDGDSMGDVCDPYTTICPVEAIYGNGAKQTERLRKFRDYVLSRTLEGQEIIRLYYQWSPAVVKVMKEDEAFKDDMKEMIDGVLRLIVE